MGRRGKAVPPARPLVAIDDGVLEKAVTAAHDGAVRDLEAGIDRLTTSPAADVNAALDGAGNGVLEALFTRGWQPADVIRAPDAAPRPWAAAMIRRRMAGYPAGRVGERWTAQ